MARKRSTESPDDDPEGRPGHDAGSRGDGDVPGEGDARSPEGTGDAGETGEGEPVVPEPTPLTQQLGRVFIVILAVLFGIFAVANSQPVDFSWVFGETEVRPDPTGEGTTGGVPLIVLLLITFAIGALVGAYVGWQVLRARRARRDARS